MKIRVIKTLAAFSVVFALMGGAWLYQSFDVAKQAKITEIDQDVRRYSQACIDSELIQGGAPAQALDNQGQFSLVVWNIYKQNKPNWRHALSDLSQGKQLVLLQEANLTAALGSWIAQRAFRAQQVVAFRFQSRAAGVMTMATAPAQQACGFLQPEPWLRLPKSLLVTRYALSNGQTLQVVNLHAINFTVSTQDYRQQLKVALAQLDPSSPAIVAGDFNTWSPERLAVVKKLFSAPQWQEVSFTPDKRSRFFGHAVLDHVFYHGLRVKQAKALATDASDHNPLQMSFSLLTPAPQ